MSKKFKEGEVVMLASGSPNMTVEGYSQDNPPYVKCVWIEKGKACREVFLESSLVKPISISEMFSTV